MKKILLTLAAIAGISSPTVLLAQTFTVIADTVYTEHDDITNKTATDLNISWKVKNTNFPADWLTPAAFGICDASTCINNISYQVWNPSTSSGNTYSCVYAASATGNFSLSLSIGLPETKGTYYLTANLLDNGSSYTKDVTFIITNAAPSSTAVSVDYDHKISLSPNPAQQSTALSVTLSRACEIQVNVTDMQGRIVKSMSKEGIAGTQKIEIGTNDLAAGLYLIQVKADGQISKEKLSVIK